MKDWPSAEIARVRETLVRAVGRSCPMWLADRRDDIVQDAMIRISGKGSDPPRASYLWRVAHSATVDEIRRHRRRREEPLETEGGMNPAVSESAQAELPVDPELRQVLLRELDRLNPNRRMAVLLQLYGFSLEESARVLGWSAKRVENHRYLGIRDLRGALKEQGIER